MIHRARFQNFKALRDVEVTFDSRLTVLVGPNGSGKTSVLQGIDWSCKGLRNEYTAIFTPPWVSSFYTKAATEEMVLELSADLGHEKYHQVRFRIRIPRSDGVNGASAFVVQMEVAESPDVGDESWTTPPPGVPNRGLVKSSFLRLVPHQLATASVPELFPIMAEDGSGLASVLTAMVLGEPDKFRAFITALREVIPSVRSIRFQRVPVWKPEQQIVKIDGDELTRHIHREYMGDLMLFDFAHAQGVHASMVSDGTLLTTGLLAWIFSQDGNRILLLDDLDHGLHPKAQMELMLVLRKLLAFYPDLQIIATSHSPYILDRLQPNEVRVMALQDDGSAVCKPLTEHPDFERWKESMSPGEFWSTFYEDWLTKTRTPQPVP